MPSLSEPVRPGSPLVAAPRARKRPGERIVAEDRRARRARRARPRDEGGGADPVIGIEDRRLDVGAHAVRGEDPIDGANRRDLPQCSASVPRAVLEVGEERHELRERDRLGCPPREAERPGQVAATSLEARELLLRGRRSRVRAPGRAGARPRPPRGVPPGDRASRARRSPRRPARAALMRRRPQAASRPARPGGRRAAPVRTRCARTRPRSAGARPSARRHGTPPHNGRARGARRRRRRTSARSRARRVARGDRSRALRGSRVG